MDPTPRLTLLDGAALVVGYGLASMLVRAYWPEDTVPAPLTAGLMALVFSWLGFAMSGPVILLIRRPPPADPTTNEIPASRTWSELAWMIIGLYWIGLTLTVVPARMNSTRLVDSAVLGVFPVVAVVILRLFGPRRTWKNTRPPGNGPAWTHRAGVALLVTWPFAWAGLIVLGQKLF